MSLYHQIALSCLPGIGPVHARNLLSFFGNEEEVFNAKSKHLSKVPGIGPKTRDLIINHEVFSLAEDELKFIDKYKIKPYFLTDADYPKRLKNCADAPILLYFKGNADLNCNKIISVVGTRNATEYGKEICRNLMADLKVHEPLIVSGLAYGIDFAAHKEAHKLDIPSIGVLGHGLDRIYPAQHRSMAQKMLECGGLLTEFMSGTIPDRENFPKRNRIIAGLCDVTIVVEASIKGGALITAELANSYNRDVFAFPGRLNDEFSLGCNHLIKTNRANLITKSADIEYIMGWSREVDKAEKHQLSLPVNLTEDEKIIFNVLTSHVSLAVDDLSYVTGFQQSKLVHLLLGMEMQGIIVSLPGKVYKLI